MLKQTAEWEWRHFSQRQRLRDRDGVTCVGLISIFKCYYTSWQ